MRTISTTQIEEEMTKKTEDSLLLLKEVTPLFKKPKGVKFAKGVRIFIYYKKIERQHELGAYDMDIYFKVLQPEKPDLLFETDTPMPAMGFFSAAKKWEYALFLGTHESSYEDELTIYTMGSGRVQYDIVARVPPRDSNFFVESGGAQLSKATKANIRKVARDLSDA